MIRYDLSCAEGHGFDSWFQSSTAFDRLLSAGQVVCPVCGGGQVSKALMAPSVAGADVAAGADARPSLRRDPTDPRTAELARLRAEIEKNSEYVGLSFAAEARAIHDGASPARTIHGEARFDEARRLIEDGVPIAPLPFVPMRKTN